MGLKLDTIRASRARPSETPAQLSRGAVDEQVRHVVDLMADDAWGADLVPALAQDWGCSESAVHDRAAQAARYLRLLSDPSEREALRARWMRRLDTIAMTGENRDAVAAIREGRELGAMTASTKLEVSAKPYAELPREEQARLLREALPRITEELARLDAETLPGLPAKGAKR